MRTKTVLIGSSCKVPKNISEIYKNAHSDNEIAEVLERIASQVECDLGDLVFMRQTHSPTFAWIDEEDVGPIEADAIATFRPQASLVVLHADCVPVLITNKSESFICAIHAGWRGTANGIIKNSIKEIEKSGIKPDSLLASLGPSIKQKHYEVGEEVLTEMLKQGPELRKFFKPVENKDGKFLFDLPGAVKFLLAESGVLTIDDCDINTFDDPRIKLESYRRSVLTGQERQFTNLSIITRK